MCRLSFFGIVLFITAHLVVKTDWPQGWASITILILFSIGLNGLFLVVIGEYVGRILKNTSSAPLVIIDSVIDGGLQTGAWENAGVVSQLEIFEPPAKD